MTTKLMGGFTTMLVYLAAATFLAELIVGWHLWNVWGMNRDRAVQMYAIAMGVDLYDNDSVREKLYEEASEEVLIQQAIDRRAELLRELDLREQNIQQMLSDYKFKQKQLADAEIRFTAMVRNYDARMKDLTEGLRAQGLLDYVQMLQDMDAEQAKVQILITLENNDIDTVVQAFKMMEDRARSKLMAELNTEIDNPELAKVLKLIRDGYPEARLAEDGLEGVGQLPSGLRPKDEMATQPAGLGAVP